MLAYLRRLLALPAFAASVNAEHIKTGYYSIKSLNPSGVVPVGPQLDHLGARSNGRTAKRRGSQRGGSRPISLMDGATTSRTEALHGTAQLGRTGAPRRVTGLNCRQISCRRAASGATDLGGR